MAHSHKESPAEESDGDQSGDKAKAIETFFWGGIFARTVL